MALIPLWGQGRIGEIVDVMRWGGEHKGTGTVGAVVRRRPMQRRIDGVVHNVFHRAGGAIAATWEGDVRLAVVVDGAGAPIPEYPRCADCENVLVEETEADHWEDSRGAPKTDSAGCGAPSGAHPTPRTPTMTG